MTRDRRPILACLHWLTVVVIAVAMVAGAMLLHRSQSYPVYTDPGAPARLSLKLGELPRDQRFTEWYKQLATLETPHKRLHDLGWGLMALGAGLSLAWIILRVYERQPAKKRLTCFKIFWILLWTFPAFLCPWYYRLRQARMDYPHWGDSIAIGIFGEQFALFFGCVVLGGVVAALMSRRELPEKIRPRRPQGGKAWTRAAFLGLWILLLLEAVVSGVFDGNVGTVISSIGFLPLMFAVLWAVPRGSISPNGSAEIPDPCPEDTPAEAP